MNNYIHTVADHVNDPYMEQFLDFIFTESEKEVQEIENSYINYQSINNCKNDNVKEIPFSILNYESCWPPNYREVTNKLRKPPHM